MNYQEQIKKAVQEFYDVTKAFASSRHYTLSYWWIESNFGLDLNDEQVRSDVHEMSYSNDFCDLIQAVDFDNDKQEVLIMMWESNNKKKYTIEDYKEFNNNALVLPLLDEFEDGSIDEEEWYKNHKIHIVVDNHDMELEYYADNVTEIYSALEEMYKIEMEIRGINNGEEDKNESVDNSTVGNEFRLAELKDIIRVAVEKDWDHFGYKLDSFAEFIQDFIRKEWDMVKVMWYYDIILKDVEDYNNRCKCNFGRLDMNTMRNISSEIIKNTIDNLICTDKELMYGVSKDNKSYDTVFVMDYTFKPSGELIGWFYGEPDEEYINDLIDDYKRNLFGEEN